MDWDDIGIVLLVVAFFAFLGFTCGGSFGVELGRKYGRCTELCRPERFVEVVNDHSECLCTTKRVKLEKAP